MADFWSHVLKTETCWLWQASKLPGKRPYGKAWHQGTFWYAHRLAWTLTYGPIPNGMQICHTCDNPACCRPAHLFLGSQRDNLRDASRKGRLTTQHTFPQGEKHPNTRLTLDDVNTIRALYTNGMNRHQIAKRYDMAYSSICAIIAGKTWKQQP